MKFESAPTNPFMRPKAEVSTSGEYAEVRDDELYEDVFDHEFSVVEGPPPLPTKEEQERQKLKKRFGVRETKHRLALKYAPEYLAQGGEQLVYELPDRPGIVAKASKKAIYDLLGRDMFTPEAEKIEGNRALEEAAARLEREKALYKKLVKHFGAEHVPSQRKYLMKVPVTPEILEAIENENLGSEKRTLPKDVEEVWTYITIQRKQEFPQSGHENPRANYPEKQFIMRGLYKDELERSEHEFASESLLRGDRTDYIREKEFAHVFRSKELDELLDAMSRDAELRAAVGDFVERTIDFAEDTGEILDFVGKDNIIFYKQDDKWTYKLLDPLYPFSENVLERGRQIMAEVQGKPGLIEDSRWNELMQAAVFVRMVNGLAKSSKTKKFLDFLPKEILDHDSVTNRLIPPAPTKAEQEAFAS